MNKSNPTGRTPTESVTSLEPETSEYAEKRLVLSERDFARFLEMPDDPSPPTPHLRAAMRAYRQLQKQYPENNL